MPEAKSAAASADAAPSGNSNSTVTVLALAGSLPMIYVDPVLVEQAFVQIVDNAAKYSPVGSTIKIAAKRNGRDVLLSVSDRGAGLSPEDRHSTSTGWPQRDIRVAALLSGTDLLGESKRPGTGRPSMAIS